MCGNDPYDGPDRTLGGRSAPSVRSGTRKETSAAGAGCKTSMSVEPDRLTRRAVLRGAAVAGAAALVRPSVGVAASSPVVTRYVGRLSGAGQTIAAPRAFTLVGVQWREPAAARIELRTRNPRGQWSQWVNASVRGHDPDGTPT